jgi:outer membrane cobalamin receptor
MTTSGHISPAVIKGRVYVPPLSRYLKIALVLCLACLTSPASYTYAAVDLPEETVEGARMYDVKEEDKYLSPGIVTVIRPNERAGEQRTLPDLLEEVPGLRVVRARGRNGYAVASVRGSTSSQVTVYVDGILMNLQSEAAVDLSAIPVDSVERIEVYRGYVPVGFGAQAMGGVINVVTKYPMKPETNVSLGIGSFGRFKGSFSRSMALGGGKFFGSFGYESYDGNFKYWYDNSTAYNNLDDYDARRSGNGFDNTDILLKWRDDHWSARASWVRRDQDLALPVTPGFDKPGTPQRQWPVQKTDRLDLSLGRVQMTGPVEWLIEMTYTEQSKYYDSRRGGALSDIGISDMTKSEYDASRAGASFSASMSVGERHFFEFLAEYVDERLEVDGDTAFKYLGGISKYNQTGWDVNLQDTISLDGAGTFLATPSVRWHEIGSENHLTWQIALTKEFSRNLMLKSAYGTYARAPNLYENYGDGAFIIEPREGAGMLKWETGTQFDLGLIWNGSVKFLGDAMTNASLSAFWRDTDDLIELYMEGPRYARYGNIARSEVKGFEMEVGFDWEKWAFSLSGTWMEGVNKSVTEGSSRYYGKVLPNRPEWSGIARLTRKFGRGSAFIEYKYVGENFADREEKSLFNSRDVFNAGIKCDLSPTSHLTLGVDDVFNDADSWRMRPDDGYDGPTRVLWYPIEGRTYYMTLEMRF